MKRRKRKNEKLTKKVKVKEEEDEEQEEALRERKQVAPPLPLNTVRPTQPHLEWCRFSPSW